ncbi:MAG TPA: DNA polymerase III subunit gamma/tau [Candidatus Moranbacteria bacterium]|nr:DNA polymerase III subunit gamma/tau [Candidatus Moranbacteria bacterium]HSA08511.1 DNA polymerase III subunit gamma/tau [Candidatus Moranbacteria bacterium]
MSLSLYRKYRPQTFSDVIGQGHIVQTLSNSIKNGHIGHAYLFTGPRGTGKTTLARIFAKAVNCLSRQSVATADEKPNGANLSRQSAAAAEPCLKCENCKNIGDGKSLDIFEIDAASNTGVDNIRELRENVKFPPTLAKYKVYIIDEVHMLSTGAFNALLKTLEEPPAHVIFILATTEIHKVPETIISRCQRYDFVRLPVENIVKKLSLIAASEKVKIEKDALEMIAIAAEGGMRDAESLLSQVMSLEDKNITAKEVEEILGTTQRQSLESLAGFILDKKTSESLALVNKLSQDGYDLDVFNKSFLNYLRQAMLISVDEKLAKLFSYELTQEQMNSLAQQAKKYSAKDFLFIIQCFADIQGKIKSSFIPQLPLEMAVIKAIETQNYAGWTQNDAEKNSKNGLRSSNSPNLSPLTKTPDTKAPEAPKMASDTQIQTESSTTPPAEKKPSLSENNESSLENSPLSLNDVKKCWNQFITEIRPLNHSLSAILQSCQPASVNKGIVIIATKFPFHKDKLNDDAIKLTMEDIFAKILGLRLRIKAVTGEEAGIKMQSSAISSQPSEVKEEKPSVTSSLLSEAMDIMGGTVTQ